MSTTSYQRRTSRREFVKRWQCIICGFVYDERLGLPDDGISPGTKWDEIPDDWMCPDCGVGKEDFEMNEIQIVILEQGVDCYVRFNTKRKALSKGRDCEPTQDISYKCSTIRERRYTFRSHNGGSANRHMGQVPKALRT